MAERDRRTRSSTARTRLDALLDDLVENPKTPSLPDANDADDDVSVVAAATPSASASTSDLSLVVDARAASPRKAPTLHGRSPRKRRRRGGEMRPDTPIGKLAAAAAAATSTSAGGNVGGHAHVMKLFDRSVDLAQFDERTPMYRLCHSWMRNNPNERHNDDGGGGGGDTASPLPPLLSSTLRSGVDISSQKIDFSSTADIDMDSSVGPLLAAAAVAEAEEKKRQRYWDLPAPGGYQGGDGDDDDGELLPADLPVTSRLDWATIQSDGEALPERGELLREHQTRWRRVQAAWKGHSHRKQTRFASSLDLLKEIWHQQQQQQQQQEQQSSIDAGP